MIFSRYIYYRIPERFGHYILATMSYGALSRAYHTYDATVQRDFKTAPMLIRDKLCVTAIGAVTAIEFWPFYLFADIGKLELSLCGEYKKPTYNHWCDYLFPT